MLGVEDGDLRYSSVKSSISATCPLTATRLSEVSVSRAIELSIWSTVNMQLIT